ncbi:glycosyltransferase family A protein [Agromyces sp. H66]|uniref:glycosyltransferase family A protein n=1 Tax=Agromyces sp. H66 TaxID=2529859 RepID=UPI0010AB2D6E|nr:glycosyltransferase family A protein [Agromyces sp. H66]
MSTRAPDVDVIVAVHTPQRPVERAVASALVNEHARVRITVVAHNTDPEGIAARLGTLVHRDDIRILHLDDGIRSPSGPFNLGLEEATGSFTSVLGSDDEFAPGAVDSWLRIARRDRAAGVIARLRHAGGPAVPTPPARPLRRRHLDPVRDRLSYRSAPLGLISRAHFADLRFPTGLASGEDIPYVTTVWFSGHPISLDRTGPPYLAHADARDRVTHAAMAIDDEFAYLSAVIDSEQFVRMSPAQRSAVAVKLIRINLFGAVRNRPEVDRWTVGERSALAARAAAVIAAGGGVERALSRADRNLLDAILDPDVPVESLLAAERRRRRRVAAASLTTRELGSWLHREGPLRFSAASAAALIDLPRRRR